MPNVVMKPAIDREWLDPERPYLFFGHGTGDTFNACLALKAMRYGTALQLEAIIPHYQLPLFSFLCECLELPIRTVYCLDFFDHNHINTLPKLHPELRFSFGFPPPIQSPGVHVCWRHPSEYPTRFGLSGSDIVAFCSRVNDGTVAPLELPTVILFTSMSLNIRLPEAFWRMLVTGLRNRGFDVRVNSSGNGHYGSEEVSNAPALNLSHPELMRLVYSNPSRVTLIGLRSGVFDILRLAESQAVVFYPAKPSWMWSSCRLDHVGYSRLRAQEVLLPPRFEVRRGVRACHRECTGLLMWFSRHGVRDTLPFDFARRPLLRNATHVVGRL